jgi:hypothetical protein
MKELMRTESERYIVAQVRLKHWLALANRDPKIHGPNLLKRVAGAIGTELDPNLDHAEQAKELWRQTLNLGPEKVNEILEQMKALTINQIEVPVNDFENIAKIGHHPWRKYLADAPKVFSGIESAKLELQSDGLEIIFIRKDGRDYVLRSFDIKPARPDFGSLPAHEPISYETAAERLTNPPSYLPKSLVAQHPSRENAIITLTEKIDGHFLNNPAMAEKIARQMVEEIGYAPDLHLANFIETKDGRVIYVDRDALEHLANTIDLKPTDKTYEELRKEIEKLEIIAGKRLED